MKKYLLGLVLFTAFSANAQDGKAVGKLVGYIPYNQGESELFFVKVENLTDSPSCNSTGRFTMKSTDPKFEGTRAAVMAALMSGIQVTAKGKGTCTNFSNSEDLRLVCLGDIPC